MTALRLWKAHKTVSFPSSWRPSSVPTITHSFPYHRFLLFVTFSSAEQDGSQRESICGRGTSQGELGVLQQTKGVRNKPFLAVVFQAQQIAALRRGLAGVVRDGRVKRN